MKLLIKDKGTSKTTGLIYASEATGYPIITRSKIQSCYIEDMAKDMGCDIPEPLTVGELHTSRVLPPETNVLFDNIETVIEDAINYYLGARVVCATMSSPNKNNVEYNCCDIDNDYVDNNSINNNSINNEVVEQ